MMLVRSTMPVIENPAIRGMWGGRPDPGKNVTGGVARAVAGPGSGLLEMHPSPCRLAIDRILKLREAFHDGRPLLEVGIVQRPDFRVVMLRNSVGIVLKLDDQASHELILAGLRAPLGVN